MANVLKMYNKYLVTVASTGEWGWSQSTEDYYYWHWLVIRNLST